MTKRIVIFVTAVSTLLLVGGCGSSSKVHTTAPVAAAVSKKHATKAKASPKPAICPHGTVPEYDGGPPSCLVDVPAKTVTTRTATTPASPSPVEESAEARDDRIAREHTEQDNRIQDKQNAQITAEQACDERGLYPQGGRCVDQAEEERMERTNVREREDEAKSEGDSGNPHEAQEIEERYARARARCESKEARERQRAKEDGAPVSAGNGCYVAGG